MFFSYVISLKMSDLDYAKFFLHCSMKGEMSMHLVALALPFTLSVAAGYKLTNKLSKRC